MSQFRQDQKIISLFPLSIRDKTMSNIIFIIIFWLIAWLRIQQQNIYKYIRISEIYMSV